MATVTEPTLRRNEQATAPRREAAPRAAEAPRAPGADTEVYWGDWLAVRVWLLACLLMGAILVLNFLAGLWGR
jgi:hypothetical protein